MDRYALAFIKVALVYLCVGTGVGLVMAFAPDRLGWTFVLLPAHAHLQLVGWVSMLIWGVAYHVLPRFSGRPLHSPRLAWVHFGFSNGGLWVLAVALALHRWRPDAGKIPLAAGGLAQAVGIAAFVVNLWKTLPPLGRWEPLPGRC